MLLCFSGVELVCSNKTDLVTFTFISLFYHRHFVTLLVQLCMLQYLGVWHEIYHYPAKHQERYSCFIDDYKKSPAGDINITSSVYDKM
jgi:lipocalin